MTKEEFEALKEGDVVWLVTGMVTASRVRIRSTDGHGATSRAWVDVIDQAPDQPRTDTSGMNGGRGLPVSRRSLVPMQAD